MKISFYILFNVIFTIGLFGQSPHGDGLKADCKECHTSENWNVKNENIVFDHSQTGFNLNGQHSQIACMFCHKSLLLSQVKNNCIDCHNDVHENTVSRECGDCHSSENWLISSVQRIHNLSRFPLLGVHSVTDCALCHPSNSMLKFEPLGVDCYDCHKDSYLSSANPNHVEEGYSTDCMECHNANSAEWSASGFNHEFFPLSLGHQGVDCASCHGQNILESISADCVDCHLQDYNEATNPVHDQSALSLECTECHTTNFNWEPADYRIHDSNSFPIYSGKHRDEWKDCKECHTNTNDYALFTCIDCHAHGRIITDIEHREERDYTYESSACFECHPRGIGDD